MKSQASNKSVQITIIFALFAWISPALAELSATLKCHVQWTQNSENTDLKEVTDCVENCKVQRQGPDGLSFSGEASSATRVKLLINSLTKNESLIFVKDFELSQITGQCADSSINKDGATAICTFCVRN